MVPQKHLATEISLLECKLSGKGFSTESTLPIQPGNDSTMTRMLLRWTRCVCGLYGVTVRNLTSRFAPSVFVSADASVT